jgi:hypothetical protein
MSTLGSVIGRGLLSARAAAASAGRLYFATDSPGTMYRDNGSSWDSVETTTTGLADQGAFTYLDGTVAAAPGTPASGKLRLYAKTGKVLAVKDDAGVETVFGASGGGGAVLGSTSYSTGVDTIWASSSSTTTADIDATNAALAITVPASGKIVVMATLDFTFSTANTGGYLVLRTGSTDLGASAVITHNSVAGGIGNMTKASGHAVALFAVTGLTPGSLTIKLGFRRLGTAVLEVYANDGTGAAGHLASPFVMTAWAA